MLMLLRLSDLKGRDFDIEYRTPFLKKFGLRVCAPCYYNVTWRAWEKGSTKEERSWREWKVLSTICELCSHACGTCAWSAEGKPVKGWRAEATVIKSGLTHARVVPTFAVFACPEFKPGRGRPEAWFTDGVVRLMEAVMSKAREDYILGDSGERKAIEHWLLNGPWLTNPEDAVVELRDVARVCDLNPKLKRAELKKSEWSRY